MVQDLQAHLQSTGDWDWMQGDVPAVPAVEAQPEQPEVRENGEITTQYRAAVLPVAGRSAEPSMKTMILEDRQQLLNRERSACSRIRLHVISSIASQCDDINVMTDIFPALRTCAAVKCTEMEDALTLTLSSIRWRDLIDVETTMQAFWKIFSSLEDNGERLSSKMKVRYLLKGWPKQLENRREALELRHTNTEGEFTLNVDLIRREMEIVRSKEIARLQGLETSKMEINYTYEKKEESRRPSARRIRELRDRFTTTSQSIGSRADIEKYSSLAYVPSERVEAWDRHLQTKHQGQY
eukprot:TRINITY_DN2620_c0_g1_i10.p1 TRINITY_DN2620_c0_g1~~TRINITY_DN2620_c0_g1_i10.p1  ORF type:complete len:296 (+),score=33.57 TRINITY_DN2620_c0_g1_i10:261-1148(+)